MQTIIRIFKPITRTLIISFAFLSGISSLLLLITEFKTRPRVYRAEDVDKNPIAIVFGAGLRQDGTPTTVLRDWVSTAANLYFNGKASKLLMSGDNPSVHYNEPGAMLAFAIGLGVPENDIVTDCAGRRTYDTCYRAKHIFGVTKAIVVTQRYHLPRTLMICKKLGLEAAGVPADQRQYWPLTYMIWKLREIPATLIALIDIWIIKSQPTQRENDLNILTNMGSDEPIRISELSLDL
jgi:SanA protein